MWWRRVLMLWCSSCNGLVVNMWPIHHPSFLFSAIMKVIPDIVFWDIMTFQFLCIMNHVSRVVFFELGIAFLNIILIEEHSLQVLFIDCQSLYTWFSAMHIKACNMPKGFRFCNKSQINKLCNSYSWHILTRVIVYFPIWRMAYCFFVPNFILCSKSVRDLVPI